MIDDATLDRLTHETIELLQQLIRNECVNDGTPDSGGEVRNAELLRDVLDGTGVDIETFEARPGRTSIVARLEGSDPEAKSMCWMGHTDVVPVSPDGWHEDPFGGALIDGEVWGRGALDMLNLTASMAVAFRHLVRSGARPRGTLSYFGVPDEEAGGVYGASWMVNHHWDAIDCDWLLTELGGWSQTSPDGTRHVVVNVAEKGIAWRRLRILGSPGHGSMPFGSDNALVTAAKVVQRLADYRPAARIDERFRRYIESTSLPGELRERLLDPAQIDGALDALGRKGAMLHACSHTTFSPNVVHGGVKSNVIPDVVDLDVDIRTLPGETSAHVDEHLRAAIGDLWDRVQLAPVFNDESSESPDAGPLWDAMGRQIQALAPGSEVLPALIVGATDSRFFRRKGTVAYGTGLMSPSIDSSTFASRFHGHDERIDVESLRLSCALWLGLYDDLMA